MAPRHRGAAVASETGREGARPSSSCGDAFEFDHASGDGLLVEQDQGTSGLRAWIYDTVTGRMTGYDETRGLTHDLHRADP